MKLARAGRGEVGGGEADGNFEADEGSRLASHGRNYTQIYSDWLESHHEGRQGDTKGTKNSFLGLRG